MSVITQSDIKRAETLHREAMERLDEAQGAHESSLVTERLERAFELEREAATAVADDTSFEPSRSILLRSAATLALRCGELREAERLVCLGLSGFPPDQIAEELRDLYDEIAARRAAQPRLSYLEKGD